MNSRFLLILLTVVLTGCVFEDRRVEYEKQRLEHTRRMLKRHEQLQKERDRQLIKEMELRQRMRDTVPNE